MDALAAFPSHSWTQPTVTNIPKVSWLLRSLCLGLLLGGGGAWTRRLQDEEVPEFDFDFSPTDRFRTGVWEIVTGYFYIRGAFMLNSLGDIAFATKEMLAGVCDTYLPTNIIARQDILTLNQPQVGLNMSFQILAPQGWAKYCVATLRFVGYGPPEGPFEQFEPPPIRPLMQASLAQYTTLDLEQMDYWAIEVGNVICRDALVSYGSEDAPPYLLERSTMPDRWRGRDEPSPCGEALQVKWTPASAVKYPWEDKPCLAAPTPCICASIRSCRYLPHPSGGKRCAQGWETERDFTRVDCEDCPYQPDCPPTCKDAYTPCMCVWWNCTWDISRSVCEQPGEKPELLSCLLCARQPHCMGLAVRDVKPESWSLLGDDDIGWFINITFNRQIMFGPLMQTTEQAIHMSCQSEAEAGMVPPMFVRFDLSVEDLSIVKDTLFVDARKVPNPVRMRFCELKILEGAIVDGYWIPMEASWGSHIFLLGDTVPPTLRTWTPDNSARNIPLNVQVEISFSEEVALGLFNRSVSVLTMGSYGELGPADQLVARFPANSPRLSFEAAALSLDLRGLLKYDVLYSIGLDPDLVQDKAGNSFAGLPVGIYAFRTVPEPYGTDYLWDTAPMAGAVTAIAIGALCCLFGAVAFVAWWKSRGSRAGANKVAPESELAYPEDLPEWNGEDLPELAASSGVDSFGEIIQDLRSVHACTGEKAKQEEVQAVTFQPLPDESYYDTFLPDGLAGDSTILEPDLTIVHKARPVSAGSQRPGCEEEDEPPVIPEVYEYYAFPPPWSVDALACPPSRPVAPSSEPQMLELPALEDSPAMEGQVLAICNDAQAMRPESTRAGARKVAAAPWRPAKSSRKRPDSAHQASKDIIKSLHESLRTGQPKARLRRPQSAPSQRVQERLLQSGAIVFRESDKRLPSYSTGFLDENRRSRPTSAAASRPTSAARVEGRLAIGNGADGRQLQRAQTLGSYNSGQRPAMRPSSAASLARNLMPQDPLPVNDEAPDIPDMVLDRAPDGSDRLRLLGLNEEMPPLRIVRDHSPSLKSPLSTSTRSEEEPGLPSLQQAPVAASDIPVQAEPAARVAAVEPAQDSLPAPDTAEASSRSSSSGSESSEEEDSHELRPGIGMPWAWQDGAFLKHQEQLFKDPNKERIFQKPKTGALEQGSGGSPLARRHRALGIRSRSALDLQERTSEAADR